MDANLKRIEKAWKECSSWIMKFDGSPDKAYLMNVPPGSLVTGLQGLSGQAENLRISVIGGDKHDRPQFIALEGVPEALAQLQKDEIDELSANFAYRSEAFDLDLHLVIYPMNADSLALELVWWNDQVFSDETEGAVQFRLLAEYFMRLQQLFQAGNLFVAPESSDGPGGDQEPWVEI